MFDWLRNRITQSPTERAAVLRIVRDDPQALGDKPDHVPVRDPRIPADHEGPR